MELYYFSWKLAAEIKGSHFLYAENRESGTNLSACRILSFRNTYQRWGKREQRPHNAHSPHLSVGYIPYVRLNPRLTTQFDISCRSLPLS